MSKKHNLIEDYLSWKNELEVTGGREYPDSKLQEDYEELLTKNIQELRDMWRSTVGEWIASRDDVNQRYNEEKQENEFQGSFEDYIEEQLKRVEEGEETAYGFTHPVSL